MQQIRPASNSETYGSNQPTAGANRTRPAPRNANPRGNFNGGNAGGAADAAPRIPTGGFNGASARPPQNPTAGRQASAASGGGFSGANALSQPKVGTFGGAATPAQPPATASGLGTPGFSARR